MGAVVSMPSVFQSLYSQRVGICTIGGIIGALVPVERTQPCGWRAVSQRSEAVAERSACPLGGISKFLHILEQGLIVISESFLALYFQRSSRIAAV